MINDAFSDIIDDRVHDRLVLREQEIADRLIQIGTEDLGQPQAQIREALRQAGLSFNEPAPHKGEGLEERVARIEQVLRRVGYPV